MKLIFIIISTTIFFNQNALANTFSATITYIYDGDTVKTSNNQKIRLACIDAPETKQSGGKNACNFLKNYILNQTVIINSISKDKYNRLIAYIIFKNININLEMVKSGNAWVYKQYCHNKQFSKAQSYAQKNKLGLWQHNNPIPPWTFRHRSK